MRPAHFTSSSSPLNPPIIITITTVTPLLNYSPIILTTIVSILAITRLAEAMVIGIQLKDYFHLFLFEFQIPQSFAPNHYIRILIIPIYHRNHYHHSQSFLLNLIFYLFHFHFHFVPYFLI